MQVRHAKNLTEAQTGIARIHTSAWSPNNKRLAIVDHGRFVHLFDEQGERRDRFSLKPAEAKGPKNFVVRGMAFSPDNIKLAVAQSDHILFVYKLGLEWGERKSICNKVPQSSPITCMCWPNSATGAELIAFGSQEGKVKVAILKTNKAQTLFASENNPCVSICASPDGNQILSGHTDGAVFAYTFDMEGDGVAGRANKIITHTCIPYSIAWGESIAVGGSDCRVSFFDRHGHTIQHYEFPREEDKDVTQLSFNPSGHCVVAATYNKLRLFNYNIRSRKWDEGNVVPLQNAYTITSVSWKADGSRIATGTLCGAMDLWDAHLRRFRIRGAYELTYVSHNQVIVKRISTGARMGLRSNSGTEVQRVNIHKDRFLVAHTSTTLLIGDLNTGALSEVPWQLNGKERFVFDNPQVCMVFVAGELCLIEYGRDEILGTCRTDEMNPHRMSVRIHEGKEGEPETSRKVIAYLMNRQEIQVDDLTSGVALARIQHPHKVDWLELNHRGTKLLFRDKQSHLFLFDLASQNKTTLLNFCSYVQWVPESDVVVAQNRSELCVWYSIESPDRVTNVPIKGEVVGIERTPAKTEVIVDEGTATVAYGLDESLILFGTAMDDQDYVRACDLLDQIAMAPETEAMWHTLSVVALSEMKLYIAERCYAALGDVAKAHALKNINRLAAEAKKESGSLNDGYDHFTVRAELCILNKEFKRAEAVYLDNGRVDSAIAMWEEMHNFDESIKLAESKAHPETANMRSKYYDWLMETGQQEKAGELREREGKYMEAINLYLRGGVPARAAYVCNQYNVKPEQPLQEAIAAALFKAGVYEKAGDFFEKLKMDERAIDAYKKGHCFGRAVELARKVFPQFVETLEESWGDYLCAQKQVDQAINHYMSANQYGKAITAAISSRQWNKAVNIIETQSVGGSQEQTNKYYKEIALHYESAQQLPEAEKYFVKGRFIDEAVEMYGRRGMTDHMWRVAQREMSKEQITSLFVKQAKQLEAKGDHTGAERYYLKVDEPDQAIIMYKKARDSNNMIRLVAEYRPDYLLKTHLSLATQYEKEGNLKSAEHHFVNGKDWGKAVNMYGERDQLDDAVRVAKVHGGQHAAKAFVLSKAMNRDSEDGLRLLIKFDFVEAGVDAALDVQKFDIALQWAQLAKPALLGRVYLKTAMHWEDQGEFRMAEDSFIKAGKPREAIDMYTHQMEFDNAMRIAESHDPAAINIVGSAHGRSLFNADPPQHKQAEELLIRAGAGTVLVKLYREAKMLQDAQRVARDHAPEMLADISRELVSNVNDPLQRASMMEDNRDYELAIESYLKASRQYTTDPNQLVAAWTRAVKLATSHARPLLKETLKAAVGKLQDLGRHEDAGRMLEQAEDYRGAINVYVHPGAKRFDLADALAKRLGPDMMDYVKQAKLRAKREEGGIGAEGAEGAAGGAGLEDEESDQETALKKSISEGNYDKAMHLAKKIGGDRPKEVAVQHVQFCLKEGDVEKAVQVISKDGMTSDDQRYFTTYTNVVTQLLPKLPNEALPLLPLHEGYVNIVTQMRKYGESDQTIAKAEGLLNVLHCYTMEKLFREMEFPDMALKVILGLPRYVNVIPAEKAYYDAGMAAKAAKSTAVAFQYLSRFLDICEKIEDGERDSSSMDNTDFATTDFPFNFQLSENSVVSDEKYEEANDWILAQAIENTGDSGVPTVDCPQTGVKMFEGALRSPAGPLYDACCITGYPILGGARASCKNCNRPANQEDWNRFVLAYRKCPWCHTEQNADFTVAGGL